MGSLEIHLQKTIYNCKLIKKWQYLLTGRIYDLGGQVLAANSAPTIFHLAKEVGAELEDLDKDMFSVIDCTSGTFNNMRLVEDYVSMISLTLKLQVSRGWSHVRPPFVFLL